MVRCRAGAHRDSASSVAIDVVVGASLDAGCRVVDFVAARSILSLVHWLISKSRHDLLVGSSSVAHGLERERALIGLGERGLDEGSGPETVVEHGVQFRRIERDL